MSEINRSSFPVLIPPAYGLQQVGFETVTGDGPISYWNNHVAVTQMGGQGNFSDPRIELTVTQSPDLVTSKLPALLDYQLSLEAPEPPRGSFDVMAALRGRQVFTGAAGCDTCHMAPTFTDVRRGPNRDTPVPPCALRDGNGGGVCVAQRHGALSVLDLGVNNNSERGLLGISVASRVPAQ